MSKELHSLYRANAGPFRGACLRLTFSCLIDQQMDNENFVLTKDQVLDLIAQLDARVHEHDYERYIDQQVPVEYPLSEELGETSGPPSRST